MNGLFLPGALVHLLPEVPDIVPEVPDIVPEVPDIVPEVPDIVPEVPDIVPDVPDIVPELPDCACSAVSEFMAWPAARESPFCKKLWPASEA